MAKLIYVANGGGKPAFSGHPQVRLELLDERRFGDGVVNLRYHLRS